MAAQRLVAVIPAYNEDRFIGSVVLKTLDYVEDVIVVDDGSTDRTSAVALSAGAQVVLQERNQGKAAALRAGLCEAYRRNADVVVLLDGDGQHDPCDIPVVVAPILAGIADIVIGSRFLQVHSRIPLWRQAGQHALTVATNLASGTHSTDSQTGYRALNRHAMALFECQSEGFAVESEMQFCAGERGLRLVEVPIGCVYAEPPKRNPVRHALQVLDGIIALVSQSRPLFFFGALGALLLIAGAVGWCLLVNVYTASGELPVGGALLATLAITLGALSAFEGLVLHMLRKLTLQLIDRVINIGVRTGAISPAAEEHAVLRLDTERQGHHAR